MLRNKRGRNSERPVHRDEEWPLLAATRESPSTEMKTQHSNQSINKSLKKKRLTFNHLKVQCRSNQTFTFVSNSKCATYPTDQACPRSGVTPARGPVPRSGGSHHSSPVESEDLGGSGIVVCLLFFPFHVEMFAEVILFLFHHCILGV